MSFLTKETTLEDLKQNGYKVKIDDEWVLDLTPRQFFNIADFLPPDFSKHKILLYCLRRNVGKNYSMLKWLVNQNKTFMIIRRRKTECDEVLADCDRTWAKLYGICRKKSEFYKAIYIPERKYTDVKTGEEMTIPAHYEQGDWIGNITSLNEVGTKAGGTSIGVDIIWFDEFLSHTSYLGNEQSKLISLIFTATRVNQEAVFIGTSNPVAKSGPLFQAFELWDDFWIESNPIVNPSTGKELKTKVFKLMAPEGVFTPIEGEEDTLSFAFASTNKSLFDMSIKGQFAENDRDKQMAPRKWFKPHNYTVQWNFKADANVERNKAEILNGQVVYDKGYNKYIVLSGHTGGNPVYALTESEQYQTGTNRIGGVEKAEWLSRLILQNKIWFTDYDLRQAIIKYVIRLCPEHTGGKYEY